ncbi:two-component regulator propeller domain-containing protein [uncultured Draconibacterium sp.]|uniref:ligand-binding sensor domain-containing protein n=1 Tax=uncultured Draconibacterium sp. TaxID=1573823 RepID=UPI00325FE38D
MSAGLSHNSALCLREDHEGFLWIGTRDGLNKFDGEKFEIFKHQFFDSTSLINNHINCLFETKEKELWIGTANGLCVYSSQTNGPWKMATRLTQLKTTALTIKKRLWD